MRIHAAAALKNSLAKTLPLMKEYFGSGDFFNQCTTHVPET
jgi:hypothetical protein